MKDLFTYTGIPAAEIPTRLAAPFTDTKAYKGVPGGADLTDINTGFMLERVTEVFGPKGLGWNFEYDPEHMLVGPVDDKNRATARLVYAEFMFYLFGGEEKLERVIIPTGGANTNSLTYVEEGARTSALGAALKGLCFQLPIYKGQLDHHNAGEQIARAKAVNVPTAVQPKTDVPTNGNHSDKELIAYGKSIGLAGAKEVTAALKNAGITTFDPNNWAAMVAALKAACPGQAGAVRR